MAEQNLAAVNQPEAAIQQINLGYNAEQDRLLLRVGLADNSELLVWLTYRMARRIWQLLNNEAHIPTATSIQAEEVPERAVEQFKHEMQVAEKLQKMDFTTEYQPRKEMVNNGAMLATNVLLVRQAQKPLMLEMPCLEGITVRMNLTQELILALCNMLQLTCKEAAWEMGAVAQAQTQMPLVSEASVKKTLH
ncbi:MAG TPA: hypothetical protein PKL53_00345 [Methylotenera sp.]|nr:hypothetical protein [Methylotenera sp.]HPV44522.1 hypothetical protein [Methylotenera sp.]